MNWFERHLNWTGLGMAVGGAALFAGVAFLSLGGTFPFLQDYFSLGSPRLVWLSILFITFLALSFTGSDWLLREKGRTSWFSFPYVIIVGLYTVAAIYQSYFSDQYWFASRIPETNMAVVPGFPFSILSLFTPPELLSFFIDPTIKVLCFFIALVYAIQWTIVVSLNSKTRGTGRSLTGKNRKMIVYIAAVILLCLAGSSGLFFSYGFLHFDSQTISQNDRPSFSFDYPASYFFDHEWLAPTWQGAAIVGIPDTREIGFVSITRFSYDVITIHYFPETMAQQAATFFQDSYEYSTEKPVLLNGKPAILTLGIKAWSSGSYISKDTVVTVVLHDGGDIWGITWQGDNQEIYEPPSYFNNLLESFIIYD